MNSDERARNLAMQIHLKLTASSHSKNFEHIVALLTAWERETRLDEAKWWEHLAASVCHGTDVKIDPDCLYCQRIAELSRPKEKP